MRLQSSSIYKFRVTHRATSTTILLHFDDHGFTELERTDMDDKGDVSLCSNGHWPGE